MPEYYPITVTRSDGLFKTTTSNGTEEANEPTASQQNSAPDEDGNFDYYKKLKPDDPKYIEWCRKLGGNLNKQLGPEKYRSEWASCISICQDLTVNRVSRYSVGTARGICPLGTFQRKYQPEQDIKRWRYEAEGKACSWHVRPTRLLPLRTSTRSQEEISQSSGLL